MVPFLKQIRRYGVASPYGAAAAACFVFVVACIFPPETYSEFLNEPDLMFLDIRSIVFFTVCVVTFLWGVRVTRLLNPSAWFQPPRSLRSPSPFLYIAIPLAVGSAISIISMKEANAHFSVFALLASQQGGALKQVQQTGVSLAEGFWAKAPLLLTASIWWALFRLSQVSAARTTRRALYSLWFGAFMLNALNYIVVVDRTMLIPLLAGSGLIYIFTREVSGRLKLEGALLYCAVGATLLIATFLSLSFFRGGVGAHILITSLLGYTVASYNRFAAVLTGQLHYFYAGKGMYLVAYFRTAPLLDKLFDLQSMLQWPTNRELYASEFASIALAGLNQSYNWPSVFGYIYADLGWGAPAYLFVAGALTGYIWQKFRAGTAIGLALYPWVGSWILLWMASNQLFNDDFVHLIPPALLLTFWDRLLLSRGAHANTLPGWVPPPSASQRAIQTGRGS